MPYCCNCGKELPHDKDILCPDCRKKLNSAAEENLEKTTDNKSFKRKNEFSYPLYFGSDYKNPFPWETPTRGLGQAVTGFIFGLMALIMVATPFIVLFIVANVAPESDGADLGGLSLLAIPFAVVGSCWE